MVYALRNDGEPHGSSFVGPFKKGSTTSVEGTFKILGVAAWQAGGSRIIVHGSSERFWPSTTYKVSGRKRFEHSLAGVLVYP